MPKKKSCRWVSDKIVAYVDGETSRQESVFIKKHLEKCSWCSAEFKEIKKTVELVRKVLPTLYPGIKPNPNAALAKLWKRIEDEENKNSKNKSKNLV